MQAARNLIYYRSTGMGDASIGYRKGSARSFESLQASSVQKASCCQQRGERSTSFEHAIGNSRIGSLWLCLSVGSLTLLSWENAPPHTHWFYLHPALQRH